MSLVRSVLFSVIFIFALEYAIKRVQVNQDGMKLNGTQHHLVYADDVNILGGSVLTVEKKTETMLVGSKESGLAVSAKKTKYMAMSREKNV